MSTNPRPPKSPEIPARTRSPAQASRPESSAAARPPGLTPLEKLYIYWMVSTLLLLFLAIVPLLFLRAEVRRQAARITELQTRVQQLETALEAARHSAPAAPAPAATPGGGASGAQRAPGLASDRPDATVRAPPAERRPQPGTAPVAPAAPHAAAAAPPRSASLQRQLSERIEQALAGAGPADWSLSSRVAAEEVLNQAAGIGPAALTPEVWEQVAVLARLLNRPTVADGFARRAAAGGARLRGYEEFGARRLLAEGDAAAAAVRLAELRAAAAPDSREFARLTALLIDAHRAAGALAAADELLEPFEASAELDFGDWLRVARACIALHRFERLGRLLSNVPPVSDADAPAWFFLQAVWLIQTGQNVAGLAVLEYLAAQDRAPAPPAELQLWRGVALLYAGQFDAARGELDMAVALDPESGEAYYWRGALEARLDELDAARLFLRNALTNDPRHVPALELLGLLEINGRNPSGALEPLGRAVAVQPRRASAHFLQALAYAKLGESDAASAALATALALQSDLRDEALRSDLLRPLTPGPEAQDTSEEAQTEADPVNHSAPVPETAPASAP